MWRMGKELRLLRRDCRFSGRTVLSLAARRPGKLRIRAGTARLCTTEQLGTQPERTRPSRHKSRDSNGMPQPVSLPCRQTLPGDRDWFMLGVAESRRQRKNSGLAAKADFAVVGEATTIATTAQRAVGARNRTASWLRLAVRSEKIVVSLRRRLLLWRLVEGQREPAAARLEPGHIQSNGLAVGIGVRLELHRPVDVPLLDRALDAVTDHP